VSEFLRVQLHRNVEKVLKEAGGHGVEECLKAAFLMTGTWRWVPPPLCLCCGCCVGSVSGTPFVPAQGEVGGGLRGRPVRSHTPHTHTAHSPLAALPPLHSDMECAKVEDPNSGSTAVVCIVRTVGPKKYLYTANCGDARAVLCRNGRAQRLSKVCVYLTATARA
jgi:hypothetical protein